MNTVEWIVLIVSLCALLYVLYMFATWVASEKERQDREWPQ